MRSNQVSVSSAAASIPIQIAGSPTFFNGVGIMVTVPAGATVTYTVQVSGDPSAPTNWNSHDTMQDLTSSANGNIAFPTMWVRLNVTSYSGSGSVVMNTIFVN